MKKISVLAAIVLSMINNAHAESLQGEMNSNYGVREDIVAYIQRTIPRNNLIAMRAALTIARQENILYYEASNSDQAAKAVQKISTANECLRLAFDNKVSSYLLYKHIENMMENTRERRNHIWDVNKKFFANNHYQFKTYNDDELKQICQKGDY
jgi:hypothetical protein